MPKTIPATNQAIINELEKKKNECFSRADSKLGHTFVKAIKGIRDCETEITSGSDAQKNINGVGPYIAKKIDEILQQLNTGPKVSQNSNSQSQSSISVPQTVAEWLAQIGYLSYLGAFEDAGYDNVRVCEELDDKDLDAIDIKKPGHRKTILIASKALKQSREQSITAPFFGFNGININSNSTSSTASRESSEPSVPKIVRTINGGVAPKLTKNFININASMSIVDRAEELLKDGHVQSIILNGDRMNCKVQGSDPNKEAYQILIELDVFKDKVSRATCSCPYSEGWCKHVVAVLLAILYEQERKDSSSPLNSRSISNSNASQSSPKPQSRPIHLPTLDDVPPSMDESSNQGFDEENTSKSKKTKKKSTSTKDGTKKARKPAVYIPTYRSGPWALLITLYEATLEDNYKGYLFKKELVEKASFYSNTSFTESENYYTGFSSMKTLITKNLVIKQKNPAQYLLTESGEQLAKILYLHKDKGELGTKKDIILPLLSPVKNTTSEQNAPKNEPSTKKQEAVTKDLENELNEHDYDLVMVKEETSNFIEYEETQSASQLFPDYNEPTTFHIEEIRSSTSSKFASSRISNNQRIEIVLDADSEEELKDSISKPVNKESKEEFPSRKSVTAPKVQAKEASDSSKIKFPFEVILLLDYREIKKKIQKNLYKGLKQSGIRVEKRNLDLGDVMWVARRSIGTLTEEVVIDFILERKRIADLMESIDDGRYKEQKFRLKKCGVKNVIYLVEGNFDNLERPDIVENALVNTQVSDGFLVQRTSSEEDTTTFLSNITKNFCELNNSQKLDRVLTNILFEDFTSASSKSKNLTVTDVFAKQLIQLNMLTPEKASAIVQTFKTPRSLLEAYQSKNYEKEKEDLLKNIEFGNPPKKRKIGSALSKSIYTFYSSTMNTASQVVPSKRA